MKKNNKYLPKNGGRNNQGIITNLNRGGGTKRRYRIIDFSRKINIGKILTIEYDPNRTAYISKILYGFNYYYYIITPSDVFLNNKFLMRKNFIENEKTTNQKYKEFITLCTSYKLYILKVGTILHNIELYPNNGAQLSRAAGTFAQIIQHISLNKKVKLKLSSKKLYTIPSYCSGTIGTVSNKLNKTNIIGSAGKSRWLGKRPSVRGVAKNPVDHPHGGGQGKTSGGRISVTPWGKLTKGKKTRKTKKLNPCIKI